LTDRDPGRRRPRYVPKPRAPETVRQVEQRIVELEPNDQALFLAFLANQFSKTAIGLYVARSVAPDALQLLAGYFAWAQEEVTGAIAHTLLRSRMELDRLIDDLYRRAHECGRGCDDAVLDDLRRTLEAPLRRQRCPCCGYYTLLQRGEYDICKVCFWEDEYRRLQYGEAPEGITTGANRVPLELARKNFLAFGATQRRLLPHVRPPLPEELPGNQMPPVPPLASDSAVASAPGVERDR
jgi:hypothetical protein